MIKYFVVSDVHSFFYALMIALESKGFDENNSEHHLIICGDAFDRGNESKQMFDFMQNLNNSSRLHYDRGNHEDLLFACVRSINRSVNVPYHHVTNGTVRTIADITDNSEFDIYLGITENKFHDKVDTLLRFVHSTTVDYYKLGKTLFVHGWVPTTVDIHGKTIIHKNYVDGDWSEARWANGQQLFLKGLFPEDVDTVVCGHWHTSWGWSNIKHEGEEWGSRAIFKPLIHTNEEAKTIIALDGCTAHTNIVNVVVFDEEGQLVG